MKKQNKMQKVMHEFKTHTLHSGKGGPIVTSRKQAIAIALSEQAQSKKKRAPVRKRKSAIEGK
ncbi:hypothetical protein UFOVP587_25 [uncultured Caudovirales phage]|uniref:Uncharacterized protein n=1 Tax=uncultured Caudovirales phage TaxID=2100421 RepID=A0A6J5N2U7_9CAUD|nr:hypothetical protein UFOVP587_25 [uncultured Caudovirales phage]